MSRQRDRAGVVVGTDGSSNALVAVQWAARAAAFRDVALTVAHVAADLGLPIVGQGNDVPAARARPRRRRGHRFVDMVVALRPGP